ncbi:unnamed protein product [Pylaiella littoralis]
MGKPEGQDADCGREPRRPHNVREIRVSFSTPDSERGRPRHLPGSPLRVFFLSGRHQQLPFCLPRLLLGVPKDIHQRQVGRCQHHGGRRRRDG